MLTKNNGSTFHTIDDENKSDIMKLNIRILIMLSMLAAISIGSCNNNSEQRVQNAKDEVDKARFDLNTAENKYANEWNQF